MKDYTLFGKKLFIFLIIIIVLDFAGGQLLGWLYKKQQSGLFYRATYAIEKTEAPLLIFGGSRANHHYQPAVFEERLKKPYYNVGRDGNNIFYHFAVLKSVLKRYTPEIIILDLNPQEFAVSRDGYDRLSSLLPYYRNHPEIHSVVDLRGPFEKYKLYSQIYPYNSSFFTILIGSMSANKNRAKDIQGYVPLDRQLSEPKKTSIVAENYPVDTVKVNYYKLFIEECKRSNVKLCIVASPYYINSNYTDRSIRIGQQIADSLNVPFYDFSRDTSFINKPQLFSDPSHFNDEGAKIYSSFFLDTIAATHKEILLSIK